MAALQRGGIVGGGWREPAWQVGSGVAVPCWRQLDVSLSRKNQQSVPKGRPRKTHWLADEADEEQKKDPCREKDSEGGEEEFTATQTEKHY